MSILKRQRELKKAEKAARKRARREGRTLEPMAEPRPTVEVGDLLGGPAGDEASMEPEGDIGPADGETEPEGALEGERRADGTD